MTTPLRVGVWGVGLMGERHARVLSTLPDARLVAVYDANADRAQAVATRYGTQVASSPEALLAEVDAISIATPTPLHFAHVEQSLSLGKHVLVEKAITEQVDQAEVLTALARRTGKLLMVGHIERYNPVFTALKGLLGERFWPHGKRDQVLVSLAPSGLFDEHALARVLATRRMAAAWRLPGGWISIRPACWC